MLRAAEIARAAFPKASVVNMLQLPGGSPSQQVMLQVRFAEVNRNALLQAGLACSHASASRRGRRRSSSGARLRRRASPVAWSSATS